MVGARERCEEGPSSISAVPKGARESEGDKRMASQAHLNHVSYHERYREELERDHLGRVVLMHDGEVIAIYNDSGDAYAIGVDKFGLGNFSVKKIGQKPVHLGIFTAALT